MGEPVWELFSLLLLQLCALLFSFSYAVKCLIRWTANRRAVVGILLFWGLLPIVPLYISWIVKDTISAALFVLFTVYLGNVLHTRRLDGKALLQLTGGGILLCLTRNDSIYCVIVAIAVSAIVLHARRKQLALCASIILVVMLSINSVIYPSLGITPGNSREALSLFTQTTARYLREHPNEVDPWESEIIERCTTVSDIAEIGSSYNSTISDPARVLFDFDTPESSFIDFLKAWASLGLKHPETYLAAFLESTVGYWYPFAHWGNVEVVEMSWTQPVDLNPISSHNLEEEWKNAFGDYGSMWFPCLSDFMHRVLSLLYNTPVIGQLFSPATYTWILAICAV